jgi:hypothetical protein
MKTPHKHAKLIKAWADGAEIEYRKQGAYWVADDEMGWYEDYEYRIKPEPKPDYSNDWNAVAGVITQSGFQRKGNLLLTFDGETGKLKSAEVI